MTLKKAIEVLESWRVTAYHNDDGSDEDSRELYLALCTVIPKLKKELLNRSMTNGDRIRAMSDEGLAEKMCGHAIDTICDIVCDGECCTGTEDGCIAKLLDWLKQPAEAE